MRFDNQNIFENTLVNGINFFLGAGFSVLSKNKDGLKLPIGNDLCNELKTEFSINGNFSLPQISTILENTKRVEFYSFLKKRFSIGEFDNRYLSIERINIKSIYTTNIDDLIYQIFNGFEDKYLNDVSHNGTTLNDNSAVDYSALHGCILSDDRKLIFDVSSLNNAYSNSPRIWDYLSHDIERTPTLFWGYSLADSGVIQSLTSNRTLKSAQKDMWIIVRKEEQDTAPYYESMGFNIIISDTEEFLDYLSNVKIKTSIISLKKNISDEIKYFFSRNLVPKNSAGLAVRPISNFIMGNPPIWSDIFSTQIYKTSYFSKVQNEILSKKNNIILGGPVTGKTTLLMQLAAFTEYPEGYKLIFNNINSHKADLLMNVFKDKQVLIFIDNFSDSIESFNTLSKVKNFTLVGFDRSHNYGIISHLIDDKEFKFSNITKLGDHDIQGIYDLLPIDQRKPKLSRETSSSYDKDSIFEFISRNVKFSNISERYQNVLKDLEEKDSYLAEFLVLASYVHCSRTPLSFDMLYSYFGDDIDNYSEIYQMREDLKDLIKDYSGDLMMEEDQDYYYPRSIYTAETILKVANKDLLKTVLETALYRIPSAQIPFYNIYRKSAYDKNLVLRAFPDWNDGKKFYEDVYEYDFKNPYVLQQGALYLAQKKRYTEAFHWIDRAITQTNNKFFSIRNSHAIILFDANINSRDETTEVRNQLDFSMSILERCIKDDNRKIFHAIRYAQQAKEYSKRYFDDKTKQYLSKSKSWIKEELRKNNWNFELQTLLKDLEEIN